MKRGSSGNRHSERHYQQLKDDLPGIVYRHTWDDWKLHKPDLDAVIAGRFFLKRGAMTQFVGWTGEGKSVLAIQFLLCVACGVPLLGKIDVPKPRRVLYIQSENDMDILHEVGPSIAAHLKLNEGLIRKNFRESTVHGVSGKDFADRLEKEVVDWSADFVVIDPYKDYVGGSMNDQETFNTWYGAVAPVMKQKNVAIMVVTHGTKAGISKDNRGKATAYSSSGDSNLPNSVRTSVELNVRGDDGRYALTFGKVPRSTGLVDSAKLPIDRLYLHQSHDLNKIYWEVCEDQNGNVNMKAYDRLVLFYKNNPEAGFKEAVEAGVCGRTTVSKQWEKAKSWALKDKKE
jgi:hypothetical protein